MTGPQCHGIAHKRASRQTGWLAAGLLLLASAVGAQSGGGEAGQGRPPPIEPFRDADVLYRQQAGEVDSHSVPVARARRNDGFVQARKTERLRGRKRSYTWSHPRGVGAQQVYEHLRAQLPEDAWYECVGRACGVSSFWAYEQFGISDLHGRDRDQRYAALPLADGGVAMLYVIRRGTSEVLAHLEVIEPEDNGQ